MNPDKVVGYFVGMSTDLVHCSMCLTAPAIARQITCSLARVSLALVGGINIIQLLVRTCALWNGFNDLDQEHIATALLRSLTLCCSSIFLMKSVKSVFVSKKERNISISPSSDRSTDLPQVTLVTNLYACYAS